MSLKPGQVPSPNPAAHKLVPGEVKSNAMDVPNNPVNHEKSPCPGGDLLVPVYTTPDIHGGEATHEGDASEVEHSSIANICKAAEMEIAEGVGDGFIETGFDDTLGLVVCALARNTVQLASNILALLGGYLCCLL